jgi:hypothetical protein
VPRVELVYRVRAEMLDAKIVVKRV